MRKRKNGFTVVELLVVMVIIAFLAGLLLPAIRKSRSKAMVDKARAEMANLASIMTMVKMDTGYYVELRGLNVVDITSNAVYAYFDTSTNPPSDSTDVDPLPNLYSDLNLLPEKWDGPYITYQPNATYTANNGSHPVDDVTSPPWNLTRLAPIGTPLDPWGHTYLVAYNDTEKVMIIYSAGPNGKLETGYKATLVGDSNADGTVEYSNSDDLLYKFR